MFNIMHMHVMFRLVGGGMHPPTPPKSVTGHGPGMPPVAPGLSRGPNVRDQGQGLKKIRGQRPIF